MFGMSARQSARGVLLRCWRSTLGSKKAVQPKKLLTGTLKQIDSVGLVTIAIHGSAISFNSRYSPTVLQHIAIFLQQGHCIKKDLKYAFCPGLGENYAFQVLSSLFVDIYCFSINSPEQIAEMEAEIHFWMTISCYSAGIDRDIEKKEKGKPHIWARMQTVCVAAVSIKVASAGSLLHPVSSPLTAKSTYGARDHFTIPPAGREASRWEVWRGAKKTPQLQAPASRWRCWRCFQTCEVATTGKQMRGSSNTPVLNLQLGLCHVRKLFI